MGKRGPQPTPTGILKLHDSNRVPARKGEAAPTGLPQMTERVYENDRAAAKWNEIVPLLTAVNLAAAVDSGALERYCLTWADWSGTRDYIDDNGHWGTGTNKSGSTYEYRRPASTVLKDLAGELAKLESQFGIGAANRVGLNVQPPTTDDLAEDMVG